MFYSNERRPQIKAEAPDTPFTEYAKIIGAEWRAMTEEDKKPYDKMAAEDKARYKRELEKYTPPEGYSATGIGPEKKTKKRRKKDPNAPKRATTAFMFYSNQRRPVLRAKNPEWAFGKFGQVIGAEWKKMTDKEKAEYVALSEKDKIRYKAEKEKYEKEQAAGAY